MIEEGNSTDDEDADNAENDEGDLDEAYGGEDSRRLVEDD